MKDPKFMDLWADYAQEISDPANLKEQEEYLKQVEDEAKQQGDHSFTFIFPKPNFCVRLDTNKERFFINICDDVKIDEPQEETTGDRQASQWQVPISLGKIREDTYKDKPCKVVDACYHPKSTYLAKQSDRFMVFLVEIAVENVNFQYHQEKKEIEHPLPMQFERVGDIPAVGNPAAQTVRIKAVAGKEGELVFEQKKAPVEKPKDKDFCKGDGNFADRLAASMGDRTAKEKLRQQKLAEQNAIEEAERERQAAIKKKADDEKKRAKEFQRNLAVGMAGMKPNKTNFPDFTIVQQGEIGYQDCFNESERPGLKRPKSLKVTIPLPTVKRATELEMGIEEKRISLSSVKHEFDGNILLPHPVDVDRAAAKFDKTRKVLTLTLPVVQEVTAFETNYRKEQELKREAFRKEAESQALEEQAEKDAEDEAKRVVLEKEREEARVKKEAHDKARKEVEERLARIAAEEREKEEASKHKRELEMQKKYEKDLEERMQALNNTKDIMYEQEESFRKQAESDHDKAMKKIKKEMEALKLADNMLSESKKKQAELPITNSLVLEMD